MKRGFLQLGALVAALALTGCGETVTTIRGLPAVCSFEEVPYYNTIKLSCDEGRDSFFQIPTQIEIVPLCPDTYVEGSSEMLLKLYNTNGTFKLMAVYDGGPNRDRLVSVVPGNYLTTDGRGCSFRIMDDLSIVY